MKTGRLVSSEEFREVMRPLTTPLGDFAVSIRDQSEENGHLPAHDSRAMAELAMNEQWSVPEWLEPVRNAHSYGGTLTYVIAEHLAALSCIIDATPIGPAYAHMPSLRALLEVVPIAHWLLDPNIGTETRIQRSITYRLHSANKQRRMLRVPNSQEAAERTTQSCQDFANAHHWAIPGSAVAGQSLPRPTEFSKVALGATTGDLDQTIWAMASATHHGNWFALVDGLKDKLVRNDPLDELGGLAPITAQAQHLFTFGLYAFFGADAVVAARSELMGWGTSLVMASSRASLKKLGRAVVEQLKKLDGAT